MFGLTFNNFEAYDMCLEAFNEAETILLLIVDNQEGIKWRFLKEDKAATEKALAKLRHIRITMSASQSVKTRTHSILLLLWLTLELLIILFQLLA